MGWTKKGDGELIRLLADNRNTGLLQRIGFSVDRVEELDDLLSQFDFDIVQAPLNILNQALIAGGYVNRLKARRVEIHVRSFFCMG